jgi:hypothetical protein
MIEEVIDLPRSFRCCVKTSFRYRHDDRWGKDDYSVVLYLYKVAVMLCQRTETDPPP